MIRLGIGSPTKNHDKKLKTGDTLTLTPKFPYNSYIPPKCTAQHFRRIDEFIGVSDKGCINMQDLQWWQKEGVGKDVMDIKVLLTSGFGPMARGN